MKFLSLFIFFLSNAFAYETCWYQHVGFRSGEPFTSSENGQLLGDFKRIDINRYGSFIAKWKDAPFFQYEIKAVIEADAGVCMVEAEIRNTKSQTILSSINFVPRGDCAVGFHLQAESLYPGEYVSSQLKKRINNQGPVFTGIQYGCQP